MFSLRLYEFEMKPINQMAIQIDLFSQKLEIVFHGAKNGIIMQQKM